MKKEDQPPISPSGPTNTAAWLEGCRKGNPDAEEALYHAYSDRLFRLIRRRLSLRLSRRFDPEDIVLSAWRSFFLRARAGEFTSPVPGGDLWPLLCTLAVRKLSKQVRRHQSDGRNVDRDLPIDSAPQPVDTAGEPETAVAITDEIEHLLSRLDATDQEVLIQTLQGADAATVATDIGCSNRTVRRSLDRIRLVAAGLEDPAALPPASRSLGIHEAGTKEVTSGLRPSHYEGDVTLRQLRGKGAFAKVYQAIDRLSGDTVAVKFLRRESWRERRNVISLLTEYEILRALRHPGIVGARGWGKTRGGGTFLVLEWVEGPDLRTWASESHSLEDAIKILHGIAEAVSTAHARGVIHGDLKPENILRRADGRTVLADFGLAWRSGQLTGTAPIGGTTGFVAPEILTGATPTIRTDIYSFGALARNIVPQKSEEIAAHLKSAHQKLRHLIERCLERHPHSRPVSATDIMKELAQIAELTKSRGRDVGS